jgi:hypothetical protein
MDIRMPGTNLGLEGRDLLAATGNSYSRSSSLF